jgi:hypothetical protein
MYSKTEVCVKIDNYRTDLFNSKLGVKVSKALLKSTKHAYNALEFLSTYLSRSVFNTNM